MLDGSAGTGGADIPVRNCSGQTVGIIEQLPDVLLFPSFSMLGPGAERIRSETAVLWDSGDHDVPTRQNFSILITIGICFQRLPVITDVSS